MLSLGSVIPISIYSCQVAVKNLMLTCRGLNLVGSIFSCLATVKKRNVNLRVLNLANSGKHQDLSQLSANQRRSFIGVI